MRQLQVVVFGLLLSLAAVSALASGNCQGNNCNGGGGNHVPAPLAGVGIPALAAGVVGYFAYRIKNRSK